MAGIQFINLYRHVEEEAGKLGMCICPPVYRDREYDMVSLYPNQDIEALPPYSRDAALFTGSLAECRTWLRGIEWARNYDRILGLKTEERRARAEERILHKRLQDCLAGVTTTEE